MQQAAWQKPIVRAWRTCRKDRRRTGTRAKTRPGNDKHTKEGTFQVDSNSETRTKDAESVRQENGVDGLVRKEPWPRRYSIVALCFTAFLLCNMDRVNMSIAILPMAQEMEWSETTKGLVQSSFFWGYLLTQIAGGIWADKVGGKKVLGFGVIWWSIATIATPIAASLGLPALLATRACMGVGEGVAMPAMNTILARWVPASERSRALALVYSGMFVGSILGLVASPFAINEYGWPAVFQIFGSLGFVWFAIWIAQASSTPAEDGGIGDTERVYIEMNIPANPPLEKIPWGALLSKKEVWAIIFCHFCHNWGTFILLTWMPTFYADHLGMDLYESGYASVLPWVAMAVSANTAGWFADTQLIGKGMSVTQTRKIMQSVGFLGPAICLSILPRVHSAPLAISLLMVSQACDAFSHSGLYSNHQDIGPRYAGILLGMSNTAGVLAGVFGTAVTGYILETGGWSEVWGVAVVLYIVGTIVWLAFSTGEQVIE
uniref:Major facilitator superfamily (MFS) profile domain-containing protein n=1 Tax=Picocystis salinarum TaxID=88271 RepID=A0A7S3UDG0_9CHLO|mmetsp:Transcript_5579/g.34625  ORF Transcript_5579/g.34625 Transcript_5579/m.34625 type:complete len:489 (+) Transcript_5579:197-1663(+)